MKSIYKIFLDLKDNISGDSECYAISSLHLVRFHKIGISKDSLPVFFIKTEGEEDKKILGFKLESISIEFNRSCQLIGSRPKRKVENGIYTVISLKSTNDNLLEYFVNIIYDLILRIPDIPRPSQLKNEIEKLVSLFSKFTKAPIKSIQGLWAELLIIERSRNPSYMLEAWHQANTDKFDFNDGRDKVEVKSTALSRRVHSFSLEQLMPNLGSRLLIASIFVVETGKGVSIFNLISRIEKKVLSDSLRFRMNEIVASALGSDLEKSFDVYFDYQLALDSLNFYNWTDIPKIDSSAIPGNITNVRFDCDLTDIDPFVGSRRKSKLYNSLF
jgi:hypothetical protein